jgi:hypothetical protein
VKSIDLHDDGPPVQGVSGSAALPIAPGGVAAGRNIVIGRLESQSLIIAFMQCHETKITI